MRKRSSGTAKRVLVGAALTLEPKAVALLLQLADAKLAALLAERPTGGV